VLCVVVVAPTIVGVVAAGGSISGSNNGASSVDSGACDFNSSSTAGGLFAPPIASVVRGESCGIW